MNQKEKAKRRKWKKREKVRMAVWLREKMRGRKKSSLNCLCSLIVYNPAWINANKCTYSWITNDTSIFREQKFSLSLGGRYHFTSRRLDSFPTPKATKSIFSLARIVSPSPSSSHKFLWRGYYLRWKCFWINSMNVCINDISMNVCVRAPRSILDFGHK